MITNIVLSLLLGAVAYYILQRSKSQKRSDTQDRDEPKPFDEWANKERMPYELRSAMLYINERTSIATSIPVPLHGKPDQVYQLSNEDQTLVVTDTKKRAAFRVYLSDRIQLSVYRTILRATGHNVAPYGYVRVVRADSSVKYLKTKLLSDTQVVQIWHRYHDLKAGRAEAKCRNGPLCH